MITVGHVERVSNQKQSEPLTQPLISASDTTNNNLISLNFDSNINRADRGRLLLLFLFEMSLKYYHCLITSYHIHKLLLQA